MKTHQDIVAKVLGRLSEREWQQLNYWIVTGEGDQPAYVARLNYALRRCKCGCQSVAPELSPLFAITQGEP